MPGAPPPPTPPPGFYFAILGWLDFYVASVTRQTSKAVLSSTLGSLSTDDREPRMPSGSGFFFLRILTPLHL